VDEVKGPSCRIVTGYGRFAPMTATERQRRYRADLRAKRDPKFYLLEANQLLDRISKAPPDAAREILHLIALEAEKRKRRLDRLAGA
jgi:hypothetical protein